MRIELINIDLTAATLGTKLMFPDGSHCLYEEYGVRYSDHRCRSEVTHTALNLSAVSDMRLGDGFQGAVRLSEVSRSTVTWLRD